MARGVGHIRSSGRGWLRRAAASRVFAHTAFLQHDFERTEVGEGGLQQVKPDERGEPKPVRAVIVREHQAQEDEHTGEAADDHVHFHGCWLVGVFNECWSLSARRAPHCHDPVAGGFEDGANLGLREFIILDDQFFDGVAILDFTLA